MVKPIKILQAYRHPRNNVLVVHFEFDFGFRSNVNIPMSQLTGLTKAEATQVIKRTLRSIYEERKAMTATEKTKMDSLASELEGTEID